MARDKITVELELATRRAEREVAGLQKKIDALGKGVGKAFSGPGGGDKVRALGSGLSKATVKADEFNKSLEASNARVIAFGASAGLIMQVDRALKGMVTSAIKVEKAMKDIAVVMEVSNQQLDKFGKGMFRVAKQTAQSFDTVAEAAVELARQGLGMEKTLSRTKDALILTRLTGMNAADSVKTLTAAVNSFNKEGVTSAQIINRMAKVDAAFAVSSEDLAKSISRVGASAVSAGVGMNELMAITTAVQQKTARGGAVIGNAFKTIFTRIQRASVQKKLKDFGVATTDMSGKMLSGIQVVQNLADKFDTLSRSQQASVGESVAGVFQINILKAAMSDLSSETSNYKKALDTANSATNEAYKRNEQLNQTLDSLVNRTLANLTAAGANLGGGLFEPVIRKVLGTVNVAIDSFGKDGKMEGFGQTIGKGLIAGIANFISGPGLVMAIAVFGKLSLSLAKFATQALKDVMGINTASKQRVALEEAVVTLLRSEPMYLDAVEKGTLDVLKVERAIFNQIKANNLERSKLAAYATPITGALMARGTLVSSKGTVLTKGGPGGAGGFIPNFASPGGERAAAAAGGYTAGGIRTMNQPGAGTIMYNTAETVKRFPGMSQSAIMPPEGSPAGAGYRAAFGGAHGFDPYAGRGFVPNFAAPPATLKGNKIGVALGFQGSKGAPEGGLYSQPAGKLTAIKNVIGPAHKSVPISLSGVTTKAIFTKGEKDKDAKDMFKETLEQGTRKALGLVAKRIINQLDVDGKPLGLDDINRVDRDAATKPLRLSEAFEGDLFEEGLRIAIQGADVKDPSASFDFEAGKRPSKLMRALWDSPISRIDAKRQQSTADNIVNKFLSEGYVAKGGIAPTYPDWETTYNMLNKGIRTGNINQLKTFLRSAFSTKKVKDKKITPIKGGGKAMGFVPNFSPLTSAIGREMQAGVPASAIRVGSSPALRGAGNPGGVGVYNTMHEPGGLGQGISRSRLMGVDPRGHGAASGLVPNFAYSLPTITTSGPPMAPGVMDLSRTVGTFDRATGKWSKNLNKNTKTMSGAADKIMMGAMLLNIAASGAASGLGASPRTQAGVSAWTNVGTMAAMGGAMGAGGGPVGIAGGMFAGAALGGLTSMGDFSMAYGEAGRKADMEKNLSDSQEVAANVSVMLGVLSELEKIKELGVDKKLELVNKLEEKHTAILDKLISGEGKLTRVREEFFEKFGSSFFKAGQSVKDFDSNSLLKMAKDLTDINEEIDQSLKIASQSTVDYKKIGGYYVGGSAYADPDILAEARTGQITKGGAAGQQMRGFMTPAMQKRLGRYQMSVPTGGKNYESWMGKSGQISGLDVMNRMTGIISTNLEEYGKEGVSEEQKKKLQYSNLAWLNEMRKVLEDAGEEMFSSQIKQFIDFYNDLSGESKMDVQMMRKATKLVWGQGGNVAPVYQGKPLTVPFTGGARGKGDAPAFLGKGNEAAYAGSAGQHLMGLLMTAAAGKFSPGIMNPQLFRSAAPQRETAGGLGMGTMQDFLARREDWYRGQGIRGGLKRGRDVKGFAREKVEIDRGQREAAGMMVLTDAGTGLIEGQKDQLLKTNESLRLLDERNENNRHQAEMDKIGVKAFEGYYAAIKGAQMSMVEKQNAVERLESDYGLLSEMSMEELKTNRKYLLGLDAKSTTEEQNLKFLQGYIKQREAEEKKHASNLGESTDAYAHQATIIEKNADFLQKQYDEGLNWQKKIQKVKIKELEIRTRTAAIGLRELADEVNPETGRKYGITRKEIADAEKTTRRAGIRAGTRGGATFGEIFGEVNAYGKTDYMLEFEDGMTSVAETMKSSFADAFKSIASGASSGKGAIVAFADALLNSISNISANMATNMMFSRLFPEKSEGGYIPRFQSGGIVTGGSGLRDDVPAMMEGGEYVIKKSSAQKIGYGTLDAINGGSGGGSIPRYGGGGQTAQPEHSGMDIAKMYGVSAAAGLVAGAINKPKETAKITSQNYGLGKSELGYLGGADPDAGGGDRIIGGRSSAQVSLNKAFVYYRRDPVTGALVSERARPTEGRFETSSLISTMGLLREDDPQTSRMFSKEQKLASYQDYLVTEKKRRKDVLAAHDKMLRGRMIGAYVNAAMLVGGSYFMSGPPTGAEGGGIPGTIASPDLIGPRRADNSFAAGGSVPRFGAGGKTSPALLMGGEYVMSPDAVRTHGANFMSELNRGNVPGGAGGGFFTGGGASLGGGTMAGLTTNNVKININVDKSGKSEVGSSVNQGLPPVNQDERDTNNEIENNKAMGKLLQGVVLKEIVQQQRPGGLLAGSSPYKP